MLFFHYAKENDMHNACDSLGITNEILSEQQDPIKFIEEVANYLNTPRFKDDYQDIFLRDNQKRFELGQITEEAYLKFIKEYTKQELQLFDDMVDYDLIHSYFLEKWSIDLDIDNIYWFDYIRKREYMLNEDNQITKRVRMRGFKPNGKDVEANEYGFRMRNKYAI